MIARTADISSEAEESERASLMRHGRLNSIHWLVLAFSLAATLAAWQYSRKLEVQQTETRFNYAADQIPGLVRERLQKYELALVAGVSALKANGGKFDSAGWSIFARNLDIQNLYPGINGIGLIHQVSPENLEAYLAEQRLTRPDYAIHPPHGQNIYQPITYIYPVESNAEAVGLDMVHEANRHTSLNKARDTGTPQITGPIVLVQDQGRTPGFLFFAPFYAESDLQTLSERQAAFSGAVYAPFIVNKLMSGTLGQDRRTTMIRISDGDQIIYDEITPQGADYDSNSLGEKRINIELYGREWVLDIRAGLDFRAENSPHRPTAILVAGIIIDLLFLALFIFLTRANRRGLKFVTKAQHRAEALTARTVEASSRLNAVMDAAQSGILGLSAAGDIAVLNPRARHMLGGIELEVPFAWPQKFTFLNPEGMNPLDASSNPLNRALAGQILKGETSIISSDDGREPRYIRFSSAKIRQSGSSDVETVLILDDVSEQERNRQQIERSSRLDALGQLTGGIAHDFNNLLATIEYSIQLSGNTDDAEKRREYETVALTSVRRGANMTRRLLAFAKQQPGLAKSNSVDDLFVQLSDLTKPTIEANIDLEFVTEENLWVYCDVGQLENAILNLVLNARDAIMQSGRGNRIVVKVRGIAEVDAKHALRDDKPDFHIAAGLQVELTKERDRTDGLAYRYVELTVTDNGPGMTSETKRRAIDPFFTTKDSHSGTGLGLSMVYGFIQQSNGELSIYSEIDHGTTIRLLLPRGTSSGTREEPVQRLPSPVGQGQTILVAEDEEALLSLMSDVLRTLGYVVVEAKNGNEALKIITSNATVDLLLTDIVMPGGIGGFQLAAEARKVRSELRIIYMSGYTGFSTSEMGDVVAPLIEKPSPPNVLSEALKAAFKNV